LFAEAIVAGACDWLKDGAIGPPCAAATALERVPEGLVPAMNFA
jgi:hypothetical protein